jgi:hypothetical protein
MTTLLRTLPTGTEAAKLHGDNVPEFGRINDVYLRADGGWVGPYTVVGFGPYEARDRAVQACDTDASLPVDRSKVHPTDFMIYRDGAVAFDRTEA